MHLSGYDRIVVMSVDSRYPDFPTRTVQLLRDHGAVEPKIFLNGRGRPGLDLDWYDMIHTVDPPLAWIHTRGVWDYPHAYREVIRRALDEGLERLLIVEDDAHFTENFTAVTMRAQVPDDWQLCYFGCVHEFAEIPASHAAPYVVRLNGEQYGTLAVGWRREAMERLLTLPIEPLDMMVAKIHRKLPSYSLEPGVIVQSQGVVSSIQACQDPFQHGHWFQIKGR